MTQFNNATFSVGGRHCDGCSQRDVWLEQANKRIKELEAANDVLMSCVTTVNKVMA